jgi:glucose-1-phosphatase
VIRAFLFDIGNVLVRFDFNKAHRAIMALSNQEPDAEGLAQLEKVKLAYEDGQIPRAEFFRQVFDILQYRGTEQQFIAAWQDIFTANSPMVEVVRQLHGRYRLFLLSNTNCMHVEGLFRDFDYFALFDGATYSHVARTSKPLPQIFEIACQQHGIIPAETLFIDDLEPNIGTAKNLGFHTHHYHPDQHEAFLAGLRELNVELGTGIPPNAPAA